MNWGIGPWGITPWGSGALGAVTTPPSLSAVSPGILNVLGGDILTVVGSDFADPALVEILSGTSPSFVVEGTAYLFDAEFDLVSTRLLVGTPALPAGSYHVRVTTDAGPSAVLLNALTYTVFAEEVRVHRHRAKWAKAWNTGPRWIR